MVSICVYVGPSESHPSFVADVQRCIQSKSGWTRHGVDIKLVSTLRTHGNTSTEAPGVNIQLGEEKEMSNVCAAHSEVCNMNVCWSVGRSHPFPTLSEIRIHHKRWDEGPMYGLASFPGFTLDAYRTYIVQHELGHALGVWNHTDVSSWAIDTVRDMELCRDTKSVQLALPWARGSPPASIMTQQSVTIPQGLVPCHIVHLYDARLLSAVRRANSIEGGGARVLSLADEAERIYRRCKEPMKAVVFDIDETLLSTSYGCKVEPPFTAERMRPFTVTYDRLMPVHDMFSRMCRLGARVFLVTARADSLTNRQFTDAQLRSVGIVPRLEAKNGVGYDRMILTPDHIRTGSLAKQLQGIAEFKHKIRSTIGKLMPVVLTVGDQWSDLVPHVDPPKELTEKEHKKVRGSIRIIDIPGAPRSGMVGVKV